MTHALEGEEDFMGDKERRHIWKVTILFLCILCGTIILKPVESQAAAVQNTQKGSSGWVTKDGAKYYYVSGEPIKGLRKIGSHKYYFNLSNGKMLRNKWKVINNRKYYFGKNGRMVKKKWIGKYYVASSGAMVTNAWVGKYFVGEDGKRISNFKGGWQKIKGKWYYYTKKGVKKTGWLTYRGNRYYLNQNGVMLTKKNTIKKKTYYFTKSGVLKKSTWVKSGKWYYYANAKGVLNTSVRMNAKNYSNATLMEYNSSTLKVQVKKVKKYSAVYWTAHVKIKNADQLKSALSYGTYGGARQLTSSAVPANGGIVGVNGSAFSYSSGKPGFDAVMIKNGTIYNKALGTSYSLMAVKWDGTMYTPQQGLSAKQLVTAGVKDTYNFGPVLLQDGKIVPLNIQGSPDNFSLVTYKDPRTAVGMVKQGEYVLLVADGRGSNGSQGLRHAEMISIFKSFGCTYAYNLDGGGSSAMCFDGRILNRPSDGSERACGDFLLFTK